MFFFWYARNRDSRQKSNLSGQIFPVLLICLAGLLVAAIVTIGVGEGAKAKTCASNAADAGSLAAASSWAAAFNKLVDRNKNTAVVNGKDNFGYYLTKGYKYEYYKRMNKYYLEMQGYYLILKDAAESYLSGRSGDNALTFLQTALNEVDAATTLIKYDPGDCLAWDNEWSEVTPLPSTTGAYHNIEASKAVLEAAECVGAFHVLCNYMKRLTDFFKANQTGNFCNAKNFMDGAYTRSRDNGQAYAFNNSCIMSKLTDVQGDDFNFNLGTNALFGAATATYSWGPPEARCSVSADVELPNIESYSLKHTKWNYPKKRSFYAIAMPFIPKDREQIKSNEFFLDDKGKKIPNPDYPDDPFSIFASLSLMWDLHLTYQYLNADGALVSAGKKIYQTSESWKACCDDPYKCKDNDNWCGLPVPPTPCNPDQQTCGGCTDTTKAAWKTKVHNLQKDLILSEQDVRDWLNAVRNTGANNDCTVPQLQDWNKQIWDNVWNGEGDPVSFPGASTFSGTPPFYPPPPGWKQTEETTCDKVQKWEDESGYKGVMIKNIDSVALVGGKWETTCTVTATCGGVTTTSSSTSKFDGGVIGEPFTDSYYPEITSTT